MKKFFSLLASLYETLVSLFANYNISPTQLSYSSIIEILHTQDPQYIKGQNFLLQAAKLKEEIVETLLDLPYALYNHSPAMEGLLDELTENNTKLLSISILESYQSEIGIYLNHVKESSDKDKSLILNLIPF